MNTLELLGKLGAPGWLVWLVGRIVPDAALALVAKSENAEVKGIIPVENVSVVAGQWIQEECHDMMDGGSFTRQVFSPYTNWAGLDFQAQVVVIRAL